MKTTRTTRTQNRVSSRYLPPDRPERIAVLRNWFIELGGDPQSIAKLVNRMKIPSLASPDWTSKTAWTPEKVEKVLESSHRADWLYRKRKGIDK